MAPSPLRAVIEADTGCVHQPCVESQPAQDLGQRTVVLGAEPPPSPERGLRLLPDMQHRIRRESVMHQPRSLVNKVPPPSGPACPAPGHSTGQAALRHGSIVPRLPGPRNSRCTSASGTPTRTTSPPERAREQTGRESPACTAGSHRHRRPNPSRVAEMTRKITGITCTCGRLRGARRGTVACLIDLICTPRRW